MVLVGSTAGRPRLYQKFRSKALASAVQITDLTEQQDAVEQRSVADRAESQGNP